MVERGECLLALGRTEEASAFAHDALDLARRFGERGHEAGALAFLATVEARRAGAEWTFHELDMPCWLAQAEAALRGQPAPLATHPAP